MKSILTILTLLIYCMFMVFLCIIQWKKKKKEFVIECHFLAMILVGINVGECKGITLSSMLLNILRHCWDILVVLEMVINNTGEHSRVGSDESCRCNWPRKTVKTQEEKKTKGHFSQFSYFIFSLTTCWMSPKTSWKHLLHLNQYINTQ